MSISPWGSPFFVAIGVPFSYSTQCRSPLPPQSGMPPFAVLVPPHPYPAPQLTRPLICVAAISFSLSSPRGGFLLQDEGVCAAADPDCLPAMLLVSGSLLLSRYFQTVKKRACIIHWDPSPRPSTNCGQLSLESVIGVSEFGMWLTKVQLLVLAGPHNTASPPPFPPCFVLRSAAAARQGFPSVPSPVRWSLWCCNQRFRLVVSPEKRHWHVGPWVWCLGAALLLTWPEVPPSDRKALLGCLACVLCPQPLVLAPPPLFSMKKAVCLPTDRYCGWPQNTPDLRQHNHTKPHTHTHSHPDSDSYTQGPCRTYLHLVLRHFRGAMWQQLGLL
eukprot:RCo020116